MSRLYEAAHLNAHKPYKLIYTLLWSDEESGTEGYWDIAGGTLGSSTAMAARSKQFVGPRELCVSVVVSGLPASCDSRDRCTHHA